jgi:hypothetical protein
MGTPEVTIAVQGFMASIDPAGTNLSAPTPPTAYKREVFYVK